MLIALLYTSVWFSGQLSENKNFELRQIFGNDFFFDIEHTTPSCLKLSRVCTKKARLTHAILIHFFCKYILHKENTQTTKHIYPRSYKHLVLPGNGTRDVSTVVAYSTTVTPGQTSQYKYTYSYIWNVTYNQLCQIYDQQKKTSQNHSSQ